MTISRTTALGRKVSSGAPFSSPRPPYASSTVPMGCSECGTPPDAPFIVTPAGTTRDPFTRYFPGGTACSVETSTSPDALPTDGWGSSAMLWALVEGLAGVVDRGRCFDAVTIAPRWLAADIEDAEASVGYAASGCGLDYVFRLTPGGIALHVEGDARAVAWHVLLPAGAAVKSVRAHGLDVPFSQVTIQTSPYVDFSVVVPEALDLVVEFR